MDSIAVIFPILLFFVSPYIYESTSIPGKHEISLGKTAAYYAIVAFVVYKALFDMIEAIRTGEAILIGKKAKSIVTLSGDSWKEFGIISLDPDQGVMVAVKFRSQPSATIRIMIGLFTNSQATIPIAEAAFRIPGGATAHEASIVPSKSGEYILSARLIEPTERSFNLKVAWCKALGTK